MAVTIPTDWNPGLAVWPGASSQPTVKAAVQQAATDFASVAGRGVGIQAKLDLVIARQTALRTALDTALGKINSHLGAAGIHIEADGDNLIAAPVATDPTADILALLNDEVAMYEAHRILVAGGVHGAPDGTNVITAVYPATTEAEAVLLGADLRLMYEAHRQLIGGGEHGAADATNTIASPAPTDWDSLVTFCNEFKNTTGFNAHLLLVGGPPAVHGIADAVNTVTAPNAGTQIAALYVEVNEFQTDYNAHVAHLGVHPLAGVADVTAVATTEATAVALLGALGTALNTHMASADDHLDADATTTPVALVATEYEDIIAAAAEWRAAYNVHRGKTSIHTKADAVNTVSTVGAGGDVAALGTGGAPTIGLVNA